MEYAAERGPPPSLCHFGSDKQYNLEEHRRLFSRFPYSELRSQNLTRALLEIGTG